MAPGMLERAKASIRATSPVAAPSRRGEISIAPSVAPDEAL